VTADSQRGLIVSIFADAVDEVWQSISGSPDTGHGGVPAMMDWLRMMELALRRMAVAA
jgi:hypothetical protein